MIIQNKTDCLAVTAICLATLSLPGHAWQAARGDSGDAAVRTPSAADVLTPSGNKAYRPPGGYDGAYHPPVPAYGYRPPANVNYGYSSGQVAEAGVAGLAVGAMAGSAAASKQAPVSTTVVVQHSTNPSQFSLGTNLNNLPGGCVNVKVASTQYYQCGVNWFRPYFGSNGAYYQVVPAPY